MHIRTRGGVVLPAVGLTVVGLLATGLSPAAQALPVAATSAATAAPAVGSATSRVATDNRSLRRLVRRYTTTYVRHGLPVTVGPNPALALVPDDTKLDYVGWRRTALRMSEAKAARTLLPPGPRLDVTEAEPATGIGANDTLATAELLTGLGTAATPAADVHGTLAAGPQPRLKAIKPPAEPDSYKKARDTGIADRRQGIQVRDRLAGADLDFYKMSLTKGQTVALSIRRKSGSLIPVALILRGRRLVDLAFPDRNPRVLSYTFTANRTATYRVVAAPAEIADAGTGQTKVTKGRYKLTLAVRSSDTDVYAVDLAAGDVLGTSLSGSRRTTLLYDEAGQVVGGSAQDASFIYPASTPLPGGGGSVTDFVAPADGRYYVGFSGRSGSYTAQVEVFRPGGTGEPVAQTVFLDFDGERLNTGIFGGPGVRTLSPFDDFIGRWGIAETDRDALVAAIKAEVEENIDDDLQASGLSGSVSVDVVTSDEVADPFGQPGVMRVVVGGSIKESGIPTIGIAQTIDPGNFGREDSALVLLDALSDPKGPEYSLNTYLRAGSDRVGFVAQALGNVIAHEVGHTLGNWHTDNGNQVANLMDAGGENFALLYGVGPDLVGGTDDDVDVDFTTDRFHPWEGFSGRENTQARSAWAVSS